MAAFINNDITAAGLLVLAKGVAGQQINYTKIVLGDDAFAHWSRMAAGVKNQTAKWYKSDKERDAKMDAQARHQ